MSTRCTVNFGYSEKDTAAKLYRHSDGYPDGDYGVSADLQRFFQAVENQTKDRRFGDPSYLAAKFVVWQALKLSDGAKDYEGSGNPLDFLGLGVLQADPGDIAYSYHVNCGQLVDGVPSVTWRRI